MSRGSLDLPVLAPRTTSCNVISRKFFLSVFLLYFLSSDAMLLHVALEAFFEGLHGEGNRPRANLSDPCPLVGNSGVDRRQDTRLEDLPDVYPRRGSLEVKEGDLKVPVLRVRNLVHLVRDLDRRLDRTAHPGDDRGRRGHREPAKPRRLRDRA